MGKNEKICAPFVTVFSIILILIFSTLEGFLNLKHLTKKVVSQNFRLADPIKKAVFKQFQRVTKDTVLGLVSRILETDEFVAVVDETDRPIGVLTHLQLLDFIANESKVANGVANGVSKTISNGVHANGTHTNGVHSNGVQTNGNHSNGLHANGHSNGHEN